MKSSIRKSPTEVHDLPDHSCSAGGQIDFLYFSPVTGLQKLNFRVADRALTGMVEICSPVNAAPASRKSCGRDVLRECPSR